MFYDIENEIGEDRPRERERWKKIQTQVNSEFFLTLR